jgi:hypothetical protein
MTSELQTDDRVWVGAGYDPDPAWLAANPEGYLGRVAGFIPGQNEQPAAVVELDQEIVLPAGTVAADQEVRGAFLVLAIGHVGTDWSTPTPRVHVELCDFEPDPTQWQDRQHGAWVESHATYRVVH